MAEHPVAVVFRGVTYKRNPDGEQRANRVYYSAPWKSGRGLLHRDVWESVNGPIPEGMHIHHQDDDPFNNDPANLVALTPAEHAAEHAEDFSDARRLWAAQIRPLTKAWHASEEGRAWHREHGKASWEGRPVVDLICQICGKTFGSRGGRARFCSRACMARNVRREDRDKRPASCPVCGSQFMQNRYSASPVTCSRRCGRRLSSAPKQSQPTLVG